MTHSRSVFLKLVALCLVLVLSVPLPANAAAPEEIMPLGSYYLDAYTTYICDMGTGEFQIWFEVIGTGSDMDEIGVLSIKLYESSDNFSWRRVKTYSHENYPTMLAYNDWSHMSYVSYQGTVGMRYKAYVCIWAGKDGDGDTRYMWAYL